MAASGDKLSKEVKSQDKHDKTKLLIPSILWPSESENPQCIVLLGPPFETNPCASVLRQRMVRKGKVYLLHVITNNKMEGKLPHVFPLEVKTTCVKSDIHTEKSDQVLKKIYVEHKNQIINAKTNKTLLTESAYSTSNCDTLVTEFHYLGSLPKIKIGRLIGYGEDIFSEDLHEGDCETDRVDTCMRFIIDGASISARHLQPCAYCQMEETLVVNITFNNAFPSVKVIERAFNKMEDYPILHEAFESLDTFNEAVKQIPGDIRRVILTMTRIRNTYATSQIIDDIVINGPHCKTASLSVESSILDIPIIRRKAIDRLILTRSIDDREINTIHKKLGLLISRKHIEAMPDDCCALMIDLTKSENAMSYIKS